MPAPSAEGAMGVRITAPAVLAETGKIGGWVRMFWCRGMLLGIYGGGSKPPPYSHKRLRLAMTGVGETGWGGNAVMKACSMINMPISHFCIYNPPPNIICKICEISKKI